MCVIFIKLDIDFYIAIINVIMFYVYVNCLRYTTKTLLYVYSVK